MTKAGRAFSGKAMKALYYLSNTFFINRRYLSMSIFKKQSFGKNYAIQRKKQEKEGKFYQKRWFLMSVGVFVILLGFFGGFLYKTGYILNKISDSDESALGSLFGVFPGMGKEMEREGDGRTNVLLLGMRGENMPGGGLLADTVMIVSIKPQEKKVALVSIPRDLYVKVPGTESRSKINAVHAFGEENGKKQGLSQMKEAVGEVLGMDIHYSIAINFDGFRQIVDTIGGIDVALEADFYESTQFIKGNECGGQFHLPKGDNHLDGETALCYVRARENTSDFDRAKRQQVVLKSLKEKLVSIGTLADFGKVNGILDSVGNNVRTDMSSSEMKKFYGEYASLNDAEIFQRVFENSEEGLLMVPQDAPEGAGYILIPRAGWDDYSQIHEVFKSIYEIDPQANINPVKQYSQPAGLPSADETKKTEEDGEIKQAKVDVKIEGKLSLSEGFEISSTELKVAQVEIEGGKSAVNKIKSLKIDLGEVDKVKKAQKIKIRAKQLELPDGIKMIDPKDNTKTILEIEVVESK